MEKYRGLIQVDGAQVVTTYGLASNDEFTERKFSVEEDGTWPGDVGGRLNVLEQVKRGKLPEST